MRSTSSLSLKRHKKTFGRAPELYGSDRGFFSETNIKDCQQAGSSSCAFRSGVARRTPEREALREEPGVQERPALRAGIEGRISVLFRGRGMKRCLAEGRERFELLVGAAVLANNLMAIAGLLLSKRHRRRVAA